MAKEAKSRKNPGKFIKTLFNLDSDDSEKEETASDAEFSRQLLKRMRAAKETGRKDPLPLDESKALYLEYPKGAGAESVRTSKKSGDIFSEVKENARFRHKFIVQHVTSSRVSWKEIADGAEEILNSHGQTLEKEAFGQRFKEYMDSTSDDKDEDLFMESMLRQLFEIGDEEIVEAYENERLKENSEFKICVDNYQLLSKYREGICNTPDLANIRLGMQYNYERIGMSSKNMSRTISLGMYLSLDAAGLLKGPVCKHCGSKNTRTCGSGSLESSCINSVCLDCFKMSAVTPLRTKSKSFAWDINISASLYDDIEPFPYTTTRWTMSALIAALKAGPESKKGDWTDDFPSDEQRKKSSASSEYYADHGAMLKILKIDREPRDLGLEYFERNKLARVGSTLRLRGGRVIIGTNPDCTIVMDNSIYSREYAAVTFVKGKYVLRKLNDESRVYVNDRDITANSNVLLEDGMVFRIDDTEFQFLEEKHPSGRRRKRSDKSPSLTVLNGSMAGEKFKIIQREVFIGRTSECLIAFGFGMGVSRKHASITSEDGEYILRDLSSSNGTYIDGKRIPESGAVLEDGSVFKVADAEIQFSAGGTRRRSEADDDDDV